MNLNCKGKIRLKNMAWYYKARFFSIKVYLLNLSNLFAFSLVIILQFLKNKYKLLEYVNY